MLKNMKQFIEYARYYDLFYGDKNYAKEADEIDKLLDPIIGKLISEDNYEMADKIMDMISKLP